MIGHGSYFKGWSSLQPYSPLSAGITRNKEVFIGHVVEVDYVEQPGKIKVRLIGTTKEMLDNEIKTEAYPIDLNILKYPLPGETVLVVEGVYNQVKSGKFVTAYYYVTTITSNSNVNFNSDPYIGMSIPANLAPQIITEEFTHRFEKKLQSKNSYISDDGKLKQYAPLKPYEGDFILQGRFGSSIRLGSTGVPDSNQWSKAGTNAEGNPIMIISANKTTGATPVSEDVNLNDSTLYVCSSQIIPIEIAASSNLFTYQHKYNVKNTVVNENDPTDFVPSEAHTYNIQEIYIPTTGGGGSGRGTDADITQLANSLAPIVATPGKTNGDSLTVSTNIINDLTKTSTETTIVIPRGSGKNPDSIEAGLERLDAQNKLLAFAKVNYLSRCGYQSHPQLGTAGSTIPSHPNAMGFIGQPMATVRNESDAPVSGSYTNAQKQVITFNAEAARVGKQVRLKNNYGVGDGKGDKVLLPGASRVGGLEGETMEDISVTLRKDIRNITLHHTVGDGHANSQGSIKGVVLRGASVHYYVDGDGCVWNYSDGDDRIETWHGNAHNTYGIGIEINCPAALNISAGKGVSPSGRWNDQNLFSFGKERMSYPYKFCAYNHRMFDRDIINLGYTWNGSRYYSDFTDRQILSLATLMKHICTRNPKIADAMRGKNVYEEVFRIPPHKLKNGMPIYGGVYDTHGENGCGYQSKELQRAANIAAGGGGVSTASTGFVIHATTVEPTDSHNDTFPSPRLVKMLVDVFDMTAGYIIPDPKNDPGKKKHTKAITLPTQILKVKQYEPTNVGAGGRPVISDYYELQYNGQYTEAALNTGLNEIAKDVINGVKGFGYVHYEIDSTTNDIKTNPKLKTSPTDKLVI